MKKFVKPLCLFSCLAVLSNAAAKEITVKYAENIKLDGILNEKAWANAETAENFTTFNGAPAAEKTQFKVLQDKFGLYFAFTAEDKAIKSEKRINGPVWFDDSIEIFISPVKDFSSDKNIREYFHFVFNPDASIFNNKSVGGILGDWNSAWSAACRRVPGGWTAEVYLPFFPYSDSEASDWRFNIGRSHLEPNGGKAQHSVWAPSHGFHNPDSFAKLKNVQFDRSFYAPAITDLAISQQKICGKVEKAAGRSLELKIDFYQQKELKNTINARVKNDERFALPLQIAPGEWEVIAMLKDGSNIVHFQTKKLIFSDSPVELDIVKPSYRNTVFPDDEAVFSAAVKFTPGLKSAGFALLDSTGSTLQRVVLTESGFVNFDLKNLPAGNYQVIGPKQKIALKIIKDTQYVKLDAQKRCVVNGKLFYPRGFMGCMRKNIPLLKKYHYNLAHSYTLHRQSIPEVIDFMDYAHQHGLMVTIMPFWKNHTHGLKGLRKINKNEMKKFVLEIKKHPAFFGWYLFDEPRSMAFTNELKKYYQLLKEWDPEHPVIGVDNSAQNCLGLLEHCDILSLDMYPSPNVENHLDLSIASVVRSCQTVAKEKVNGVFWYTPQAFSRESYPSPAHFVRPRGLNIPEIRASVYGSIAAGANGQLPFKIGDQDLPLGSADRNAGIFNSVDMQKGFLDILGNELKDLEEVLLGDALEIKGNGLMRAWRSKGNDWILIVNPDVEKQTVKLEYSGNLYRWPDGKVFERSAEAFTLEPYEVLWLTGKKLK